MEESSGKELYPCSLRECTTLSGLDLLSESLSNLFSYLFIFKVLR